MRDKAVTEGDKLCHTEEEVLTLSIGKLEKFNHKNSKKTKQDKEE